MHQTHKSSQIFTQEFHYNINAAKYVKIKLKFKTFQHTRSNFPQNQLIFVNYQATLPHYNALHVKYCDTRQTCLESSQPITQNQHLMKFNSERDKNFREEEEKFDKKL